MDINPQTLIDLGAERAIQIRAGSEAYKKIRLLPRVTYDPNGNDRLFWRGTPVARDASLAPWTVEVDS